MRHHATAVSSGTLFINGDHSAATGGITVSGGKLSGIGTVSGVSVTGGTLAPGSGVNTVGTLNTGNLSLNASSTFAAAFAATTQFSAAKVTGTVALSNAALTGTFVGGYPPASGDKFKLIDNDGADPVIGTFNGLAQGAAITLGGNAFIISYAGGDGNDVELTAGLVGTSSNADLSVLSTTAGSITFAAVTTAYTVNVPNATTITTITATRAEANATLQVQVNSGGFTSLISAVASGSLALNVGSNTIDVKVTAQDGTTIKTYTITVTRRSIIEDWRLGFFADVSGTANRADGADFDLDGKSNLLEFAFGTDPSSGSSGPPDLTMSGTYAAASFGTTGQPVTKLEPMTNGVDFRAVFVRRVDHAVAGLTYTPEFSADNFTSFTPSATIPTVLVTNGDFQLVSVPYPHFLPSGKKAHFFRVSVSITP